MGTIQNKQEIKLLSMTDFVLDQYAKKIIGYDEFCIYVVNYANFLKQPLELWMFDKNDERCLFDGWEMRDSIRLTRGELSIEFHDDSVTFFGIFCDLKDVSVIEDLVKYNLQIKKLGL